MPQPHTVCILPDDWKSSIPVFKKGNKNHIENYRPVSLTSRICMIFEMIVRDAIVDHLESNRLISHSTWVSKRRFVFEQPATVLRHCNKNVRQS